MGRPALAWALFAIIVTFAAPGLAQDADLVGWWPLDGNGTDASGNGHDGILEGDARFLPGYSGEALYLDGDADYFTVTDYKGLMSTNPVTVTAWVQTTGNGTMVYWGRNAGRRRVDFRVNGGRLRVEHGGGNLQGDTNLNDGEWHHVGVTIPPNAPVSYPEVKLWLDGRDDSRNTRDPEDTIFELVDDPSNVDLTFGRRVPQDDRHFPGFIDEVRLYSRVLAQGQIQDLMELGYLAGAHSPSPSDGSKIEEPLVTLEWAPGPLADSYNLYFGTSFEDVNDGAESALVGNMMATQQIVGAPGLPEPEGLQPGTTYYWRVEAVSGTHPDSPWGGDVWSFWLPSTAAYDPLPADGEPFEDPNVVLTWAPGLRAILGTVYFGTDANEVANATGGLPMLETTYDPRPLEPDTTYYWRADTFNGTDWVAGDVWTFTTMPVIEIDEPNLVAWWTFDEGAGSRAVDWSGHGNHARLRGPEWQDGGWAGNSALSFDGEDDYLAIENLHYEDASHPEVTVCAWVRTSIPDDQIVVSFDRNQFYRLQVNGEVATDGQVGWHVMTDNGDTQVDYGGLTRIDDGLWHYVCGVFDNGTSTIYIDGTPEPSTTGGPVLGSDLLRYGYIGVGSEAGEFDGTPRTPASFWNGEMDEIRIYDVALTQDEILQAMRGDALAAWDLQPSNGRILQVGTVGSLSWRPGDQASQHDVYLGTDAEAVAMAGTADTAGVYRGRQGGTTYAPPESLDWGTTYYWRIDEVNNDQSVTTGNVRAFTIADYVTVEDFESYANDSPNRLFQTWVDGLGFSADEHYPDGDPGNGTGAAVGHDIWTEGTGYTTIAERQITYDGGLALPLYFNNDSSPYRSEADRTWSSPQNWTVQDVDTLAVHFTAGGGVDPNVQGLGDVYLVVQDGSGQSAVLTFPGPDATWQPDWLEWNIPLTALSDAGVNTTAITKLTIGIGSRNSPAPDGSGVVYVDAIRLTKAEAPSVENFSFELPGTEKQTGFDDVPGWNTDDPVVDSGVETDFTPTDGLWTAYLMGGDPAVWQLTEHTVDQGDVYELKVDARITWAAETLRMSVFYVTAGERVPVATADVALAEAMQEYTLTFAADDVPASIGRRIGIEFVNPGSNWIGLDNVRLERVSSP